MDESQEHRDGTSMRRTVLGDAHVDQATAATSPLTLEFQDLITRYAWGEIWTRPGLNVRSRRILVIGTMVALGRWEELRMHLRAALVQGGFEAAELKEILLQQAIYCGVPAAHRAFVELIAVVDESSRQSPIDSQVSPNPDTA